MRLSAGIPCVPYLTCLLAVGCATPQPLVRLAPLHRQTVVWVAGRATQVAEKDGVRVAVAFDQQDGARLGVRIEVENDTDEPLQIDPALISFSRCATSEPASCQSPKAVINPERIISALDAKASIETADAANDATRHSALVILSAIDEFGNIASGHPTGEIEAASADAHASALGHDSAKANLRTRRQLWADVALRRNTLFPGQGVAGQVFIPVRLETRAIWLHIWAGDQSFTFPFAQKVISLD